LYEENVDLVYAYVAKRVRERQEAEDITADVFHDALKNLPRFEWRGVPFAAWLLRIAANAIADRGKRRKREFDALAMTDHPARMTAVVNEAEPRARLFRLVGKLPDDQRRVIAMRFAEQKSIAEIASAMSRSAGAIKQLQFRALKNLRTMMGKDDG
jgi:RNA polymerase sigma-70 factor (ECF subfamily)